MNEWWTILAVLGGVVGGVILLGGTIFGIFSLVDLIWPPEWQYLWRSPDRQVYYTVSRKTGERRIQLPGSRYVTYVLPDNAYDRDWVNGKYEQPRGAISMKSRA